MKTVVLYRRDGCHLCDEALEHLLSLRASGAVFSLDEIDIESDDRLHREMLERVPVIEIDGVRVSELLFDGDAIRAALATVGA